MPGVADHSLFGNKQQLNTNKLFSNTQLIKHYIVSKENKEDGETKCEKANSQRHFNSAQLYTQMLHRNTIGNTVRLVRERVSSYWITTQRPSCEYKFLKLQKKWKYMSLKTNVLRHPTDLTQKPVCLYWERCHLTQAPVLLRYTINGAERLMSWDRPCILCLSWALSYNTQSVLKDKINGFCISAYKKTQRHNFTPLRINSCQQLSVRSRAVGLWFVFSSEVEPRASHKTGKGSTTSSILSLVFKWKNGVSVKLWP